MTAYLILNSLIAVAAAAALIYLVRRGDVVRVITYAGIVTAYSLPWDYFAIQRGAWHYPAGYLLIFSVPLNDIIFIFFASLLTITLILRFGVVAMSRGAA